jgi:hypothetical protein
MYPDIPNVVYMRSKRGIFRRRSRRNQDSAFFHTFLSPVYLSPVYQPGGKAGCPGF